MVVAEEEPAVDLSPSVVGTALFEVDGEAFAVSDDDKLQPCAPIDTERASRNTVTIRIDGIIAAARQHVGIPMGAFSVV